MKKKSIGKVFQFKASLEPLQGHLTHSCIVVPDKIVEAVGVEKGIVRVKGFMNEVPFNLAFHSRKIDKAKLLMIAGSMKRTAKVRTGEVVNISFSVIDPNHLELPEELEAVLEQDDHAKKCWEQLTIGYRRSLVHYITTTKNVDIRIKRSLELIRRAKAGELPGAKKREG